ncbi:Mu transposase C-terminal domain-containing protein [Paracoccus alkanivorans]|uniref:Integrase catalytic domain-containing protein n=1 Tax=Paracoccus alkanivorans TaxID=2116655 RepID=A0A3M0MIM1_9RHOB|nr:Mu transposase C-terminal domain-containing protein [Paracoccus alkanivorans]RMC37439.1 hypothetical protein C9E81_01410 [Paracoccus alkanivorans]
MTIRFRFSKSDMINVGGVRYRPLENDDNGALLEHVGRPDITERMTHEQLAELFKRPDTQYFADYFDRANQEFRGRKPVDLVNELPGKIRHLVLWREAFCKACLTLQWKGELRRTAASYHDYRGRITEETNRLVGEGDCSTKATRPGDSVVSRRLPGYRTGFNWLRRYEKGGFSAFALIPETHRCGNRKMRWCHRSEALMTRVIEFYASTQRPSKAQAIADTLRLFDIENERRSDAGQPPLVVPSAVSIDRRLKMADPYYVHAKRYGIAAANSKFTLFETGPDVERPLERVEMDENQLDVISLLTLSGIWDHLPPERQAQFEKGRRWLYIAVDCATKCILTMRLAETPNSADAIRALRDIFIDKTPIARAADCESKWHHHGGIGTLVTDMGAAFVSDDFQGTVSSLAITAHLPPAGIPWLRGHVESFFRTFGHQLMPLLSGRTFFNSVERGDYPSEQLACLCDDDLIRILLTYVVDIYHNQPHGSLGGETPNEAWDRLVAEHGTPPVPDGLTLRRAFGRPLRRKLRGDGVRFAGISYNCEALREAFLHSPTREVEIRADLKDLGWVAVKVGATWYPAVANQQGFDGVSYDELVEATRALRLTHRKNAELAAPVISRAIKRISEANRQAFLLRELTPFHVSDQDVERNQNALHYPIRSDAERMGQETRSNDPLKDGIPVVPKSSSSKRPSVLPSYDKQKQQKPRERRNRWRFDDDK